jgi:hypothetical protein
MCSCATYAQLFPHSLAACIALHCSCIAQHYCTDGKTWQDLDQDLARFGKDMMDELSALGLRHVGYFERSGMF